MQQPVSMWLTLPSSGRLVFDISSRAISIVFLLRNNLNLASLFIVFEFKVKFTTISKHRAYKFTPRHTEI